MQQRRSTLLLGGSLLAISLFLPSCLIGTQRDIDSSGTYISETTYEQVKPGQSSDFVLQLFGEPSKRIQTEATSEADSTGSQIWKWEYSKEVHDRGSVFLIVNAKTTTRSDGTVFVEIKDDKVVKAWRD